MYAHDRGQLIQNPSQELGFVYHWIPSLLGRTLRVHGDDNDVLRVMYSI